MNRIGLPRSGRVFGVLRGIPGQRRARRGRRGRRLHGRTLPVARRCQAGGKVRLYGLGVGVGAVDLWAGLETVAVFEPRRSTESSPISCTPTTRGRWCELGARSRRCMYRSRTRSSTNWKQLAASRPKPRSACEQRGGIVSCCSHQPWYPAGSSETPKTPVNVGDGSPVAARPNARGYAPHPPTRPRRAETTWTCSLRHGTGVEAGQRLHEADATQPRTPCAPRPARGRACSRHPCYRTDVRGSTQRGTTAELTSSSHQGAPQAARGGPAPTRLATAQKPSWHAAGRRPDPGR